MNKKNLLYGVVSCRKCVALFCCALIFSVTASAENKKADASAASGVLDVDQAATTSLSTPSGDASGTSTDADSQALQDSSSDALAAKKEGPEREALYQYLHKTFGIDRATFDEIMEYQGSDTTGDPATVQLKREVSGEAYAKMLQSDDPAVRQWVLGQLTDIEDPGLIDVVMKTGGFDSDTMQEVQQVQTNVKETIAIKQHIKDKYGITVVDSRGNRFGLANMERIETVLDSFDPAQLKGITSIHSQRDPGAMSKLGAKMPGNPTLPADDLGSYFPDSGELFLVIPEGGGTLHMATIFHEVSHGIDKGDFGYKAFGSLHAHSKNPDDYQREYGETNANEDFATTNGEGYCMDSEGAFERGISQAQQGDPVYLDKIFFVLTRAASGILTRV